MDKVLTELESNGFSEIPSLLPPQVASTLLALYRQHWGAELDAAFQTDTLRPNAQRIAECSRVIRTSVVIPDALGKAGFEAFSWGFVGKRPGAESEVGVHQDWSVVVESAGHRSLGLWIALHEIPMRSGRLEVAPGTHRRSRAPRGDGLRSEWLDALRDCDFRQVATKTGDSVVFDEAIAHRSRPNLGDRPRCAVRIRLKPQGAPLVQSWRLDAHRAGMRTLPIAAFADPFRYLQRRPSDSQAESVIRLGGFDLLAFD